MTQRPKPAEMWSGGDILETLADPGFEERAVVIGMTLTHVASGISGKVVVFSPGDAVALVDGTGARHVFTPYDGAFAHGGVRVALRRSEAASKATSYTPSGSIDAGPVRAQVAKASRIWVEGVHDAELIGKIWGDDLRVEGIVVEALHGADDLPARVGEFAPGPNRRLGVLLDHLVAGSKESRIAASIDDESVLVCGHPYVDIWQAIKPSTVGIDAWPVVPKGRPWKEGIVAALGVRIEPGKFWAEILAATSTYLDVETPLINAVEQLIDFVTAPTQ